jgi:pimeloyl-ACP methyl ester carboxylesterase
MAKAVEFTNGRNQTLRGFIHEPLRYKTAVVFLHGFPTHCNYPAIRSFSRALSVLGNLVLRFNFSGTDNSDGNFEDKRFSQEVEDIKYAIDYLTQNYQFEQLVLVGHSGGAIDASLYAHRDKRVDKVVLISGVSDLEKAVEIEFTKKQIKDFEERGYIVYNQPGKWQHQKRLNRQFYDEFFKLDIPKTLKRYKKPLLIIHGSEDETIPVSHAHELYETANKPKQLMIIEGADHNLSKLRYGLRVVRGVSKFIKQK